ncbi:MAG: radical SAM protein [bacterium]
MSATRSVTLVYPGISTSGFNTAHLGWAEASWIHHGLASLSAALKRDGAGVSLLDLRRMKNWGHFRRAVSAADGAVFGVTMMSVDYDAALRCAALIRAARRDAFIFAGGAHPSIMTDELKDVPVFDCIFTGEAEASFPRLVRRLADGDRPGRIVRGEPPELDAVPFADRDLFGPHEYPMKHMPPPFITLIAGRGCRYNCNFCQPAERLIFGRRVRRRSPENVIAELKSLRDRYGFSSFLIHDDCLTEDAAWVESFCGLYRGEGFAQPFACQSRADHVARRRGVIETMRGAGLAWLIIGFESGSQRVLNFLRKGTTVKQNLEAARVCRELGIRVWANYMLGIPSETKEEAMETVRMIRTIAPDHHSPSFYTPLPGSDLFAYCLENGLSRISSHGGYKRNPYGSKIRGVDYRFLRRAAIGSMGLSPAGAVRFILLSNPRVKRALARARHHARRLLAPGGRTR